MGTRRIALAAATAAALVAAVPSTATAAPAGPAPKVLTTAVAAPFNLAVGKTRLLVADGGPATLSRLRADGTLAVLAHGPKGGEVAGVAISRTGGYVAYTTTVHPSPQENTDGTLNVLDRYGATATFDLAAYEASANPDGGTTYGAPGASACAKAALEAATGNPVSYTGLKDSHPYSVAAYTKGSWLVADAGGNDLLQVSQSGKISTVAVLPAQPYTVTAAAAKALGLPDCVIGVTYRFESVPTDVEVGRDGWLYVTTLAGGPESPVLGARSSVYRINPHNGQVKRVATGLAGATNLALVKKKIYVAELYAGRVTVLNGTAARKVIPLPGVVSVEAGNGRLYAGTLGSANGPGTIVELTKGFTKPLT